MDADVIIESQALRLFATGVLTSAGIAQQQAEVVADVIVFADESGIPSHGTMALAHYIHHLESGGINPNPSIVTVSEGAAYAIIDADNSLGAVAAKHAASIAIAKADHAGVATVTVRNSNHFGAGAYYALMGVEAGMLGEVFSNVPPMMAPTGGKKRVLGNNPLSIAAPAGQHPNFVLDMAMSAAAGGRIIGAAAAGKSIPEGWLLDVDGAPTTDPQDFHRGGALVPFGGYKGYGLALAAEAFAGVLSGSGICTEVKSFRRDPTEPSRTGHTFRMTKIEAFLPLPEFRSRMDFLMHEMKSSPKADGVQEIMIPGEPEAVARDRSRTSGVRISSETHNSLLQLSRKFGIEL